VWWAERFEALRLQRRQKRRMADHIITWAHDWIVAAAAVRGAAMAAVGLRA
jgi:hypothetical protein